jgi:hypothetical protein
LYEPITDGQCQPLQLRLKVEGTLIGFYRLDTGEKLLIPNELAAALKEESKARQQAEAQLEEERQRAENFERQLARYREQFGELSDDT